MKTKIGVLTFWHISQKPQISLAVVLLLFVGLVFFFSVSLVLHDVQYVLLTVNLMSLYILLSSFQKCMSQISAAHSFRSLFFINNFDFGI